MTGMETTELKLELHKIIDQIRDNRVLEAVYTLLTSRDKIVVYSSMGDPLEKEDMDAMLKASESDIQYGRLTNQKDLKQEVKSWQKK